MNKNLIFNFKCLELNFNQQEKDIASYKRLINQLISSELPFKIKNFKMLNEYSDTKEIIKQCLSPKTQNLQEKFKISASMDKSFSGNSLEHSQIEMSLDEYFNYKGEITLYLSQINLLQTKDKNQQNGLEKVLHYSIIEELIPYNEFSKINIWHSFKNTLSKFHYDSYDNFLYLIKGKKEILMSYNKTKFIKPSKIGENSGNQCDRIIFKKNTPFLTNLKQSLYNLVNEFQITGDNLKRLDNDNISHINNLVSNYKEIVNKITKNFMMKIDLYPNELIFIPEGWWHQVETIGDDNLAFNFWWEKTNKLVENGKEMFLIKQSLSSLVEKKIKLLYKKCLKKFKKEYKIFSVKNLQKLLDQKKFKPLIELIFNHSKPKADYEILKWVTLYCEFEKHKNADQEGFFEFFWKTLQDYQCDFLFMEKINEMKHKISVIILDEMKKVV